MTDAYIAEIDAIRREQASGLPPELAEDPTFMSLLTVARFGLNDAESEAVDTLIALAYSKGRVVGAEIIARNVSNIVRIR